MTGSSQNGVVFRHVDLSVAWPWSWDWLEQDLRALATAGLPQLVTTRITRKGADQAVMTRPFVAGRDIRAWASADPRPSGDTHLRLMCELFSALAQLHRLGIVHGGLKPANVLVSDDGDHLVLVDAGVTRTQLAATSPSLEPADARYLSPEQAGLVHRTVGFAADLYAAGWVLLESVADRNQTTGALPTGAPGRDAGPAEVARLLDAVGVPPGLRPIFRRLMAALPEQRYETAEEALAALEASPAMGSLELVPPAGTAVHPAFAHAETPLVGRRAELDRLGACVDTAVPMRGVVLCMTGAPGLGKSRLLDAVAARADVAAVTVLRGQAFDHAAQRPLGLFAGVFRELAAYLRARPAEADRVRGELGELLGTAIAVIPDLADVFPDVPGAGPADGLAVDGSAATTAIAVAARLFDAVFTESRPGVLIVDDCQWADDLSWQLLAKLATTVSAGDRARFSLLCSLRPEALAQVKTWGLDTIEYLELQPLARAEAAELVRTVVDRLPDEIVRYVLDHSAGNPLEMLSALRALIDSSALTLSGDRWVVDTDEMRALPSLPSLPAGTPASAHREGERSNVFFSARLDRLSDRTRLAAGQAAVLGRRFSCRALCRALGEEDRVVHEVLREATDRGILRVVIGWGADTFEFTHDRLRDAVLGSLSEADRRALHRCAAVALEAPGESQNDYEIAYHLSRSGEVPAALPYALRAGEAALRQNALDVAEVNFRIAEAGLAAYLLASSRETFRVFEGLGSVHMLLGKYDLASKELAVAYDAAETLPGLESARAATLLGELAFKTGKLADAGHWMQRGMQDLRLGMPTRRWVAGLSLVPELGRVVVGLTVRSLRPARAWAAADRATLAARIYNRMLYEWWFARSPIWLVWGVLRALRFSCASGSTKELSQAYSATAVCIAGLFPSLSRTALRVSDRSLRMRRAAHDDWGIAQSKHFRGFVLLAGSRYEEAIATFDTAIAAFDVLGDRWEQIAAKWQKALCLYRLGRLHEAGVLARETYWDGKRIGDRIGAGTALTIWVRCLPGDVSAETISRELQQTAAGDLHTIAMLHAARGWRLIHRGRPDVAVDAFREAARSVRTAGIRNHFVAPIAASRLSALRLWHDAALPWLARERRARFRAARRQLAESLLTAAVFRSERPTVLREWAVIAFARGQQRRGRLLLGAAARSAASVSAAGELAACAHVAELAGVRTGDGALGRLGQPAELCRPLRVRVDRGIVEAVSLRVMPTLGDSSRHQALLEAVRAIVASDDVEEVLDKLREAAATTTTARAVDIVALPAGETPDTEPVETERITKTVVTTGPGASALVAAFPFGEAAHHEATVEVLAALAGAVVERETLRRGSLERIVEVQEAERDRIARDLHDDLGHLFAGIIDGLSALEKLGDGQTRRAASAVREIAREGIQTVRTVAWMLRPSGLDDLGLDGCVEQFVTDCRRMFRIRIEVTATGQEWDIPAPIETAVFRIVQEALTNVGRHSGATEASVLLVSSGDTVRAVVEDDGAGFDVPSAGQHRSLGLTGMRERARLVGGKLTVESAVGAGTTIVVEVPIR
jgi:two-component system sensor kinase